MKIRLTKKQYKNLLKLVYLGNWMVNSIRSGNEGDKRIKKYDEIEQYIFSFAKKAGLEKYIEFDKEFNQFFPTLEFEENTDVSKYIQDYEEEVFWEELVLRLARRDFIRKYGRTAILKMNLEERIAKEYPFEKKYRKEIEKNGLKNLEISKPPKSKHPRK